MWWKLFQLTIVFLVIASNIHWQWTPNPYLAAVYGGMLAFGLTWLLNAVSLVGRARRAKPPPCRDFVRRNVLPPSSGRDKA